MDWQSIRHVRRPLHHHHHHHHHHGLIGKRTSEPIPGFDPVQWRTHKKITRQMACAMNIMFVHQRKTRLWQCSLGTYSAIIPIYINLVNWFNTLCKCKLGPVNNLFLLWHHALARPNDHQWRHAIFVLRHPAVMLSWPTHRWLTLALLIYGISQWVFRNYHDVSKGNNYLPMKK